ncbi:MAG: PorV/PorQ family protein [Balneolaceae bacterium]
MKLIKPIYIALFAILLMVLPSAVALAQAGGFTGSFSRMGFAPRGMAMGNALVATPHEGAYAYYNPAYAARPANHIQVDLSTSALAFDRKLHMASGQFQLPPSAGISVAILNGRVSDIDGRTQSGYTTETFSTNEYQLLTNFGIRFSETFWGGIGIKINRSDFHSEISPESSLGVDFGLFKQTGKIGIGLAVQDLFAQTNYDTSSLFGNNTGGARSNNFPTRFKFGGSYLYNRDLMVSAEYEIRVLRSERLREETSLVGGRPVTNSIREDVTTNSQFFRVGTRYALHPRATLRAGIQANDLNHSNFSIQPTAGFSLHLPLDQFSPSVDYAFMREPSGISTMHVFSIRLNI